MPGIDPDTFGSILSGTLRRFRGVSIFFMRCIFLKIKSFKNKFFEGGIKKLILLFDSRKDV